MQIQFDNAGAEQEPKCIQCGSLSCGPVRCRFTMVQHQRYREILYADAMIRRDKADPYRDRPDLDMGVDGRPLKAGS